MNNEVEVEKKESSKEVAVKKGKGTLREQTKGRKTSKATDNLKDYQLMEELGARGLKLEQIAAYFGINERTLQTHRKLDEQIDMAIMKGRQRANIEVANALFNNAKQGNVTAQIFWMKAMAGWRDTQSVELTGKDGGAIELTAVKERLAEKLAKRSQESE